MKAIHVLFIFFVCVFGLLFSFRAGVLDSFMVYPEKQNVQPPRDLPEKETWMTILQNERKIGYSHSRLSKAENGYRLEEDVFMRIKTIGVTNDLLLKTSGRLNPDLTVSSFDFSMSSGRFQFALKGKVSGRTVSIQTGREHYEIDVGDTPFLASGIVHTIVNRGLGPGDSIELPIFNPASMTVEHATITISGKEDIQNMGMLKPATKVEISFSGVRQYAWIGEDGDMLREQGVLGLVLERTTRSEALYGLPIESSDDLTEIASVAANVRIDNPEALNAIALMIDGIDLNEQRVSGGRQRLRNNTLTIYREDLSGLEDEDCSEAPPESARAFLTPSTFIESDHADIRQQVRRITAIDECPLMKARKIVGWVKDSIEKRPVLSVPDALETLRNRQGDCNEHAVLTAALARAAGIPAKVEAGLMYMKGRFYYHAWNSLYVGRWITADATLGTMPADVTHIRLSSGLENIQSDIMAGLNAIQLTVVDLDYDQTGKPDPEIR